MAGITPPPAGSPFDDEAGSAPSEERLLGQLVPDEEPRRIEGEEEDGTSGAPDQEGGGDGEDGELIEELLPIEPGNEP